MTMSFMFCYPVKQSGHSSGQILASELRYVRILDPEPSCKVILPAEFNET